MATDVKQIKELLGVGLSAEIVADAVGCTPAYISQLMADSEFANDVAIARSAALQANTTRDRKLDGLEDRLIETLEATLDLVYKPKEVLAALATVNRLQRRGVPASAHSATPKTAIVQLSIPTHLTQNFVLSANKEVIEVEGQTMVTMPAHQLLKNLQQQQPGASYGEAESQEDAQRRAEVYKRISNYLPSAAGGGSN